VSERETEIVSSTSTQTGSVESSDCHGSHIPTVHVYSEGRVWMSSIRADGTNRRVATLKTF